MRVGDLAGGGHRIDEAPEAGVGRNAARAGVRLMQELGVFEIGENVPNGRRRELDRVALRDPPRAHGLAGGDVLGHHCEQDPPMALVQCHRHVLEKVEARGFCQARGRGRKIALGPPLRQARPVRPSAALLPFSLMVMAIMTVPTLVLDEQGLPRYRHLRGEVEELRESNEELVREIATLKGEIEALRSRPELRRANRPGRARHGSRRGVRLSVPAAVGRAVGGRLPTFERFSC